MQSGLLTWQEHQPNSFKQTEFLQPSEIVMFGEKKSDSTHYYMDLLEPSATGEPISVGNDYEELEQARHTTGSDYGFVDNSVRFLKRWQSMGPIENRWAMLPGARTIFAYDFGQGSNGN